MAQPSFCWVMTAVIRALFTPRSGPLGASSVEATTARTEPGAISRATSTWKPDRGAVAAVVLAADVYEVDLVGKGLAEGSSVGSVPGLLELRELLGGDGGRRCLKHSMSSCTIT